jgi:hypothetical protein
MLYGARGVGKTRVAREAREARQAKAGEGAGPGAGG